MTKKDYIKIAAVLKDAHGLEDGHQTWCRIINGLTRIMIDDNPRFSLKRFEDAATPEASE